MTPTITATKLVVRDADAAERFYTALGFKLVSRNTGGEGETRQKQSWLSASGDMSTHLIVVSEFTELPPPRPIAYPGEAWLAMFVADIEAACETVKQAGGSVVRAGKDQPEHQVRAAIVADPEGHIIELVGPIQAS